MAITKAEYDFFHTLKNLHRTDPPFKVLMYACKNIDVKIIRDEITLEYFEIWKDEKILFKGSYDDVLEDLFVYIFSTMEEVSCTLK